MIVLEISNVISNCKNSHKWHIVAKLMVAKYKISISKSISKGLFNARKNIMSKVVLVNYMQHKVDDIFSLPYLG
jgi:hypothetical protein